MIHASNPRCFRSTLARQQPWQGSAGVAGHGILYTRPRGTAVVAAGDGATAEDRMKVYTSPDQLPLIGPVVATHVAGKGRGLETTRTVELGELLLISKPLAVADINELLPDDDSEDEGSASRQDEGSDNEGEDGDDSPGSSASLKAAEDEAGLAGQELTRQLQQAASSLMPAEQQWLQLMCDGSEASARELPDLASLAEARQQGQASASSSGASSASALANVEAKVKHNYLAHGTEDLGLLYSTALSDAAASGDPDAEPDLTIRSPAGIWPEAALLNHSCMPNTVSLVHKGRLYVRAARGIAKQGEVTINYLGDDLLAPRQVRMQRLQQQYGFSCSCPRCSDEGRLDSAFQELLQDMYEASAEQLQVDLQAAVERGDEASVRSIRDQLATYVQVLDAALTKFRIKPQSQTWIQASLFRLYELLSTALFMLDESDPRLLELLQALAANVCPGSDAHLFWSMQYRGEVEALEGRMDAGFRHADKLCQQAYGVRYGRLTKGLYRKLLEARALALADEEEEGEGEEGEEA